MKIKHKKALLIAGYFFLSGIRMNDQIKTEKITEIKEQIKMNPNWLESSYLDALENSHFNEQERKILKERYLPYLLQYQNTFDDEFLANILFSTENTYVNRDKDFNHSYLKASFSTIIGLIPYGKLFAEGIISLAPDYSQESFYHEYCHITQSWNQQKNIYGEAYANFCSNGNYNDLYGIFTMLGILGDSKQVINCLANGKMENYWELLQNKYPNLVSEIEKIRKNIEMTFQLWYKQHIFYKEIQIPLRETCISYIEKLYQEKYHRSMKQDSTFQVLVSMYLQEKQYFGRNNPFLEEYILYSEQGMVKKIKLPE